MELNKEYWQKKLTENLIENNFSFDHKSNKQKDTAYKILKYNIPSDLSGRMCEIANQSEISMFLIFMTGMISVIHRLSITNEVFTLLPITSKDKGKKYVNNILPLLTKIDGNMTFRQILTEIKNNFISTSKITNYSFDALLKQTRVSDDYFNPVYETAMMYHEIHNKENFKDVPFKILFALKKDNNNISLEIEYQTNLFEEEKFNIFTDSLFTLLKHSLSKPDLSIKDFEILTPKELSDIQKFGQSNVKVEQENTGFIEEFKKVVSNEPNNIAIRDKKKNISYSELDQLSDSLALDIMVNYESDNIIAVAFPPSTELIVAILAIIKSGKAFLPIDFELPYERISYMLDNAGVSTILGADHILDKLETQCCKLNIDLSKIDLNKKIETFKSDKENPIYVIYTSGSTGKPKGVVIKNESLINYCKWFKSNFKLNRDDKTVLLSSHTFDLGFSSIFPTLISGGTLSLIEKELYQDSQKVIEYITRTEISFLKLTPSYLSVLVEDSSFDSNTMKSLRLIVVGGEPINKKIIEKFMVMHPHVQIVNHYGPTEATIGCISHILTNEDLETGESIPIGTPISNNNAFIIDPNNKLLPRGFEGELAVSGVGLSKGYLNTNVSENEKFVQNNEIAQGRLYKTGDIAVLNYSGKFEYIKRKDDQLKVRGYRIEPGEIEQELLSYNGIKHTHVRAREMNDEIFIVAYLVNEEQNLNKESLSENIKLYLEDKLPTYMIPKYFIFLDEIPVTSNNKIDIKSLPLPQVFDNELTNDDVPQTTTQKRLIEIWKEIIKCDHIGINDSFFALGGHSVMMIKTISRIRKQFKAQVYLKDFFTHPTVKELSARIEELSTLSGSETQEWNITPKIQKDKYDISPVQYPEWFLQKLNSKSVFYNQTYVFEFNGSLNYEAFKNSFTHLTKRHDVLRTKLKEFNGKPYQVLTDLDSIFSDNDLVDIRDYSNKESVLNELIKEEYYKIFRLSSSILFRVKLIRSDEDRHILVFSTHHIVWDQLSSFTFFREFQICYNSYCKKLDVILPIMSFNYIDYSEWLNKQIEDGTFDKYKNYWINKFEVSPKPIELGFGKERKSIQNFKGKRVYHQLKGDLKSKLEKYCKENGFTSQIYLLSILNLLMYKITGQKRFVVGTPTANRDDKSFEGIIGLFAAALPILCDIENSSTFLDLLNQTREESLDAYDNRLYPFNKIIENSNFDSDFSRSKIMSIFFGVQNDESELYDMQLDKLDIKNYDMDYENYTTAFDITLQINHSDTYMLFSLRYDSELIEDNFASQMLDHYISLLEQTLENANNPIDQYCLNNNLNLKELYHLDLHTDDNRSELQDYWGKFEENLDFYRNNTAIISQDQKFSYNDLVKLSLKYSNFLSNIGVQKGDFIGVCLDPSESFVAALLGIMKIGAVYVPISKDYPKEKIQEISESIEFKQIITDHDGLVDIFDNKVIRTDLINESNFDVIDNSEPVKLIGDDLAYVIFTSGSTGKPKGIKIQYKGLINIFESVQNIYELSSSSVLLMNTPIVFDPSLLDVLWPLLHGACIVIPKWNEKGLVEIAKCINEHQVNMFQCVPTFLSAFISAKRNGEIENLSSLKSIIVGGDILSKGLYENFRNQFDCKLFNHYGPTETTIDVAIFDCSLFYKSFGYLNIVPIGKPTNNTCLYILDKNLKICPAGVPGELYISSIGNSLGYINDTNEDLFIPNLFADGFSSKLYKSGDKAFYCDDGNIVILGRIDNQVKIDGNRIELGEIEYKLNNHKDIANAAVLVDKKLDKKENIIAFVEPESKFNQLEQNGKYYRFFTVKDNSGLKKEMDKLHSISWPDYFGGSEVLKSDWEKIYINHPEFQFVIFDDQDNKIGVGNSVPILWNGDKENLPKGWDGTIIQSCIQSKEKCNTLVIFAGVINPKFKGNKLGNVLIDAFISLASASGMDNLLVILRPIQKNVHQELSIEQYIEMYNQDPNTDKWIKMHIEKGGEIIKGETNSQCVKGTVSQWEEWTNTKFSENEKIEIGNVLSTLKIDFSKKIGIYNEPGIWIDHSESIKNCGIKVFEKKEIWKYTSQKLQKYMNPHEIIVMNHIPLLPSMKNDRKKLEISELTFASKEKIKPNSSIQNELFEIFTEILNINDFGINEGFFHLGGQSINALVLLSKIQNKYEIAVNVVDLYMNNTILELEKFIEKQLKLKNNKEKVTLLKEGDYGNILLIASPFQKNIDFSSFTDSINGFNIYMLNLLPLQLENKNANGINDLLNSLKNEISKNIPGDINIVLAYSSVAILAHELISKLEEDKYEINRYIVIDGKPNLEVSNDMIDVQSHVDYFMLDEEEYSNKLRSQLGEYIWMENNIKNSSPLNCPICVLYNEYQNEKSYSSWSSLTKGGIAYLKGIGNHLELISEKYAAENIEILLTPKEEILEDYSKYLSVLKKMIKLNNSPVSWIKSVPNTENRLLFLNFFGRNHSKYNSLEVSMIQENKMEYVWLPGALSGGFGEVDSGIHNIVGQFFNDEKPTFIQLNKHDSGEIELISLSDQEFSQNIEYITLEINSPEISFLSELEYSITTWIKNLIDNETELLKKFRYSNKISELQEILKDCKEFEGEIKDLTRFIKMDINEGVILEC